ncbi:MAG TPA: hypothetical protein DEO40_03390 [Treponema sp.]|jgi:hypothetical protein|nr:hypothetical protein [Treponema sp.]HAK69589.1 hypothetical protein [Treponema sp.]HCA19703.1 hypothetical protein [Treponema sp.]
MARTRKLNVGKAFRAFADKFSKSTQVDDDSRPNIVYEDKILQDKINAKEEEYLQSVVNAYKKYVNPYTAYGKNSVQAQSIADDEKALLTAYNLFKSVHEANQTIGDRETYVNLHRVESPLSKKICYTSGGEFIYLQCWLMYEQGIRDFVPVFESQEKNYQTEWSLVFVPAKNWNFAFQDREVIAAIESVYHPGKRSR